MFYVYTIQLSNKKLYTGYTNNLKRRYNEHASGEVISTKRWRPHILIYFEAHLSKKDAKIREKYFKTTKGKTTLKMMLRNYLS